MAESPAMQLPEPEPAPEPDNPPRSPRALATPLHSTVLFLLGAFAGLVSVVLPRLMLSLSVDSQPVRGSYISFFHVDFLILALIFAVFLGIVAVIFEGSQRRPLKEIFLAALGFPAVLSGVLNTTSATNKLEKVEQAKVTAEKTLTDLLGLPQTTADTLTILGNSPVAAHPGEPPQSSAPFSLFPSALAQSPTIAQQVPGFDPGIRLDRPGYVVVLKAANSEEEAKKDAAQLRSTVPTVQAIRTDKGLFVIDSASPRSSAEAARDAIRLRLLGNSPSLLQVPNR